MNVIILVFNNEIRFIVELKIVNSWCAQFLEMYGTLLDILLDYVLTIEELITIEDF